VNNQLRERKEETAEIEKEKREQAKKETEAKPERD